MAYGQKYQSDFYNIFRKLVSVKIYERDYAGSVTNVRTSKIDIKSNYQDDNTPIIGSGATITIIANTGEMSYLEDMLTSYERQFMCTIEYGGQIVFRGYSISDLNERQFLQYAEVTMQFTDYLHRMEEYFPARLRNVGGYANVFSIIQELLTLTGLDLPIYVNSTLFEQTMSQGGDETFLTQIVVQNSQFYADLFNYDNIYDAVNKCLHPFNAYMYYYNEKWVIERIEDIINGERWVLYQDDGSSAASSLKQTYNKQVGDFEYVDTSQVIEYNSGLKTLILQLQDKKLDSLVYNNYTEDMLDFPAATFPDEAELLPNVWYKDAGIVGLYTGVSYLDLETYFHFNAVHPDEVWVGNGCGVYYNFNVVFPVDFMEEAIMGIRNSFNLTISYKATTDSTTDITDWKTIVPRFLLRLDGGPYSGWWVKWIGSYVNSIGQSFPGPWLMLCAPEEDPMSGYESLTPALTFYNGSANGPTSQVWNVDKTFDLNKQKVLVYWRSTTMNFRDHGLWDELGNPEFQRFTIIFLPTWYWIQDPHQITSNYIGDITVQCTTEDVNNKIEYYINEDFYRSETIDLYLFDLPNPNYSNGLMLDRGFTEDSSGAENIPTEYTKLWVSRDQTDPPAPLYEIFAKNKFRKYGRTTHRLKGTIMCDRVLKPFSILTDDNMLAQVIPEGESGGGQGGGYSDWYLPDLNELDLIRDNLYLEDIGGIAGYAYWSSDDDFQPGMAAVENMVNGIQAQVDKNYMYHVRAVRSFTSVDPSYSLGDTGPAGGWIFSVSGDNYKEAAPSDQSASTGWNNAVTLCENYGSTGNSGEDMQFLLNAFTWDLVNGTYDIEAEEYCDEDVIVQGLNEFDSEGQPIQGDPPPAPTGLTGAYLHIPRVYIVQWQPVGGVPVTGYKLQRSPFFHVLSGVWEEMWWLYYTGTDLRYIDDVKHTGPLPVPYSIKYRVCAYNDAGDGPWSDEIIVTQ